MFKRRHNRLFPITEAERIHKEKLKEKRKKEIEKEYTDRWF